MTKCSSVGRRYIARILDELKRDPYVRLEARGDTEIHGHTEIHRGAFLAAALAIIKDVPSPAKERALVSLVAIKSRLNGDDEDLAHEQRQRLGNFLGCERLRRWG